MPKSPPTNPANSTGVAAANSPLSLRWIELDRQNHSFSVYDGHCDAAEKANTEGQSGFQRNRSRHHPTGSFNCLPRLGLVKLAPFEDDAAARMPRPSSLK